MRNKAYCIKYIESQFAEEKNCFVSAGSAAEAYDKAVYEELESLPYAAYVYSYTANNGNYHRFRTNCFGKAY